MMTFFDQFSDVLSVLSLRDDGPMNLTHASGQENRNRFFSSCHISPERVFSAGLVHGNSVSVVGESSPQNIDRMDALVTRLPEHYLSITVADCYPVFFYAPSSRIVGIAHAGWRGVVSEVILRTFDQMVALGADVFDIHVAIGPGISQPNYIFEHKTCVVSFGRYCRDHYFVPVKDRPGYMYLNLQKIILDQCTEAGVSMDHVDGTLMCTFADPDRFFSARRDSEEETSDDRMIALIGLRKS
ncbi:MAG: laccase domain-containing protein [Candidatus Moranbacteria bacterium]|nr:laccase domain-containing protein [Candidatus Moranbacteria bacterium]